MAPNGLSALDNPPSASPSAEISDSQLPQNPVRDSDEEREPSKEEEEEEEEESETSSDDDDDTALSNFTVKPVVSKKPSAPNDVTEAQKKPLIVRIWTEEGELAALRAMHEYRSKKGLDPSAADVGAFYEFAKKLIPIEVTKNQVMDKICRLKKKYKNNAMKEGECFELSKKIWGGGGDSGAKQNVKKSVEDSVEEESNKKAKKDKPLELVKDDGNEILFQKGVVGGEDQVGFWDKYPKLKEALEVENNGSFLKYGKKAMEFDVSKMGDAKAKDLENKWKHYQAKEAELKLFKLELVTQQTKVVLDELMRL